MSEFTDDPDEEVLVSDDSGENGNEEDESRQQPIASELLQLTNDFAAFSADCAFFCDAFAAIAEEQEDMNDYTSYGARRNCNRLKEQVINLDCRIHELQRRMREQSCSEHED
ncbi:hypothetical protein SG34_010325 [Thalassomonas viridans]|uniref:Uncharacterized protein n=1 Tax=Thalassomonas viridans TaxID=137584 RepID=A0AAE9Z5Q5_9GAMM|nr:hypothetical protein [Thalassomonas viridans]WDE07241.1 hypothetical protein SG34_010325 [Thalassomonas viridans]